MKSRDSKSPCAEPRAKIRRCQQQTHNSSARYPQDEACHLRSLSCVRWLRHCTIIVARTVPILSIGPQNIPVTEDLSSTRRIRGRDEDIESCPCRPNRYTPRLRQGISNRLQRRRQPRLKPTRRSSFS